MEQESATVFGKRQVAQFIEHDTFHSGEACRKSAGFALFFFPLQLIYQIDNGKKRAR